MRSLFHIPLVLVLLFQAAVLAQTPVPPPAPTNFSPSTPLPKNIILPSELNIPANIHIEVTAARKRPSYLQMNPQLLLLDPDLVSAVIERDDKDIHATFHWQGDHSSEAFIIRGTCFQPESLKFPDTIRESKPTLCFLHNDPVATDGAGGNFPDVYWYAPSYYAGTASLNGNRVLVFSSGASQKNSAGAASPTPPTFPVGSVICLDATSLFPVWISDTTFAYTFTYTPDTHVQINPQGAFLAAIKTRFGHYP